MFTLMAAALPGGLNAANANQVLTSYRPSQLAAYQEMLWRRPRSNLRQWMLPQPPPPPAITGGWLGEHQRWADPVDNVVAGVDAAGQPIFRYPEPADVSFWHHLTYAYMIENTRIVEIFRRVVYEYVHGERLPFASMETQAWLRNTEELFFTSPRPSAIPSLTSLLRPDDCAIRRNAYFRMLGMDLTHGADGGTPYPFVKGEPSNRELVRTLERLLQEVWRGYMDRWNFIGPRAIDDDAILELVRYLREMMTARRTNGNLSREEFDAVVTLSWFHLTVMFNTRVVESLTAQSTSPALRLKKIADRVAVPMHAKADSFFQLALPLSLLFVCIENGAVETLGPDSLYRGVFTNVIMRIITHWSIVTGREIKGVDVRMPRVAAAAAAPSLPVTPPPAPGRPLTAGPMPAMAPASRLEVFVR